MNTIIVVGGGASGLACASVLAGSDNNVIILEQAERCGKKILATGNGRCNISNENMDISFFNEGNSIIEKIIKEFDIVKFFSEKGMLVKKEGSLYYPFSNQAITVKEVLERQCQNCSIITNTTVLSIEEIDNGYYVETNAGTYQADYVVVATGSPASKLSGNNNLLPLSKWNIDIKEWKPSLVSLYTKPCYKKLKGVRTKARVSLLVDGKCVEYRDGEVQFTDYGISGICIMQLSRFYHRNCNKKVEISIDLCKDYSALEIKRLLKQRLEQFGGYYYQGMFNDKLANIIEENNLYVKDIRFTVLQTRATEFAQVMQGGVVLSQINDDLELKEYKNVFIGGEVLDVDGDCGGYNLHFAFASGYYIASKILDRIKYVTNK